jgi:CubicO group peptidase (beta-lactamase class C family)
MAAATSVVRPEEVGLSADRLQRINDLIKRHIDAGTFSGAVTLVARQGRVAHFEAQGLMDIESRKPMQKDAIFRIMSMTKPIVGASIMMMIEEGKVRLTDPVSKFIPELKDLKVAVTTPAPAGQTTAAGTPARFYTVPAEREITIRDLADTHVRPRQRRHQQPGSPERRAQRKGDAGGLPASLGQSAARLSAWHSLGL